MDSSALSLVGLKLKIGLGKWCYADRVDRQPSPELKEHRAVGMPKIGSQDIESTLGCGRRVQHKSMGLYWASSSTGLIVRACKCAL